MNEPIPLFKKKSDLVLIVEDDPAFQLVLTEILTVHGYKVVTANDGREGLEVFKQHKPGLIITDIIMPDSEGLEFIMQVRKQSTTVPIIAISGGNFGYGKKYLRLAEKFGVNAIFPKPFELAQFVSVIKKCMSVVEHEIF